MFLNPNNTINLEGRLTGDPELTFLSTGTPKCKFNLAVDRVVTKQQKENGSQSTDFIPCEALGKTAEYISNFFVKGSALKLVGTLCTYSYTAQDGTKKYGYNVSVNAAAFTVSSPNTNGGQNNNQGFNNNNQGYNNNNQGYGGYSPNQGDVMPYGDDIPF